MPSRRRLRRHRGEYCEQVEYSDSSISTRTLRTLYRYFDNYFKASISTSNTLRQMGGNERLVFLTHPYLLSLYLDCPPNMGLHCPDNDSIKLVQKLTMPLLDFLERFFFRLRMELAEEISAGTPCRSIHSWKSWMPIY